jgi:hypothetical protein
MSIEHLWHEKPVPFKKDIHYILILLTHKSKIDNNYPALQDNKINFTLAIINFICYIIRI